MSTSEGGGNTRKAPIGLDVKGLTGGSGGLSPTTSKALRTPAEEGLEFFGGSVKPGEAPIQVYELKLEADGGPAHDMQVGLLCSLFRPRLTVDSISDSRQRIPLISFEYRLRLVPPQQRMESSRLTFRWMERPLEDQGLQRRSMFILRLCDIDEANTLSDCPKTSQNRSRLIYLSRRPEPTSTG